MELFKILGTIALNNSEAIKGMKDTTSEAENTSSKVGASFEKIGAAAIKVGKVMAVAMGAGVTALSALTKASLDAYANYEQLVGGVETIFGAGGKSLEEYAESVGKTVEEVEAEYNNLMMAQETVMKNASEAYNTAGLSANQYMETVTSFSASLIQSLEGDTVKASELANQAIIDMSDNANKMGTDMAMIQNAYNGFAKQNYMMLDNLKLGYGGTKTEMERLLEDAEKIQAAQGNIVDYSIDSYSDIINAIHDVQTEMGITGTTAEEAEKTITGSLSAMKAAWANLVTGLGNDQADLSKLIDQFVDKTSIAFGNILPRIEIILKGIATLIKQIVPQITGSLPSLINEILPPLLEAAASLIQGLADAIPDLLDMLLEVLPGFVELGVEIVDSILEGILDNIGKMGSSATEIVVKLTTGILQLLPKFLEVGAKLIVSIIQGISKSLPQIIQTIKDVNLQLINVLIQNLPLFIEAGLQFIVSLAQGILEAVPDLLAKMPEIIQQLVETLLDSIDLIIDAGVQLLTALVENLDEIINAIVVVLPQIITAIIETLTSDDGIAQMVNAGVQLITAIVQNIDEIIATVVAAIPALITGIFGALTNADALGSLAQAGIDLIYSLLEGMQSVWGEVTGWFSSAVNSLLGLGSDSFANIGSKLVSKVTAPNTSSVGGGAKKVGVYADGGVVPKGQIAFLEGQGAEAVVPLDQNQKWISAVAQDMNTALGTTSNEAFTKLEAKFDTLIGLMQGFSNMQICLDSGVLVGELTDGIDASLGEVDNLRKRGG